MELTKLLEQRKKELKNIETLVEILPLESLLFIYGLIAGLQINIKDLEKLIKSK